MTTMFFLPERMACQTIVLFAWIKLKFKSNSGKYNEIIDF